MSDNAGPVYDFVFRGLLAEDALDQAGREHLRVSEAVHGETARILSLELLDDELVSHAKAMATVYTAITAFENSVRKLIATVLLEQAGEGWWATCVSDKIRARAEGKREEEERVRWHAQRGADPIYYTQMGDLVAILRQNWAQFEPYVPSIEWATSLMDVIERSRNVIMHSGALDRPDIERVGIFIRDWVKQVGA